VSKFPKLETTDIFKNKVLPGNIVMFSKKGGLKVGVYIRQTSSSCSIAIRQNYYGYNKDGTYGPIRNFTLVQSVEIFLIEDPINNLDSDRIRDALEIVSELKNGRHLPKDFDENISWGINTIPV
jgi:hypothetical protein